MKREFLAVEAVDVLARVLESAFDRHLVAYEGHGAEDYALDVAKEELAETLMALLPKDGER